MSRILARTALTAVTGLAGLALLTPAVAPADAVQPQATQRGTTAKHVVTFTVASCEGCQVRVSYADPDYDELWQSRSKPVTDGVVSFAVPNYTARALSATVIAPWEGTTGYVTQVVFRYTGEDTGDHVTVAEAKTHQRGTLCLKGDAAETKVTVPITVRKVVVPGTTGPTNGTLAFASTTQRAIKPISALGNGVGGAQEVPSC